MAENELAHYGVLGMKWGVRKARIQAARVQRKDVKWANKHYNKIYKRGYKSIRKELNDYVNTDLRNSGKVGKNLINQYNKKLAELMNKSIGEIEAPSGKVVQFIAKRGDVGVHMALADRGYDISQVKNGIYNTGRIAYKKKEVNMV